MKAKNLIAMLLLVTAAVLPCKAQDGGNVILFEQSPADGGMLSGGVGARAFAPGETVTVTAVPKPGYEFFRWLGPVDSPESATITLSADKPMYVVAVYQKSEFAAGAAGVTASAAGQMASSQAFAVPSPISSPGSVSAASSSGGGGSVVIINQPNKDDDLLVPDPGGPGIVVPDPENPEVPEPATIALLGVGALILRKARANKLKEN